MGRKPTSPWLREDVRDFVLADYLGMKGKAHLFRGGIGTQEYYLVVCRHFNFTPAKSGHQYISRILRENGYVASPDASISKHKLFPIRIGSFKDV